jgi:hypothetical protein
MPEQYLWAPRRHLQTGLQIVLYYFLRFGPDPSEQLALCHTLDAGEEVKLAHWASREICCDGWVIRAAGTDARIASYLVIVRTSATSADTGQYDQTADLRGGGLDHFHRPDRLFYPILAVPGAKGPVS